MANVVPSSSLPADSVVMNGTFLLHSSSSIYLNVQLTPRYLIYRSTICHTSNGNEIVDDTKQMTSVEGKIAFADITGCHIMRDKRQKFSVAPSSVDRGDQRHKENGLLDLAVFLCIYFYPIESRSMHPRLTKQFRRTRRTLTLRITEGTNWNERYLVAQKWQSAILWLIRGSGSAVNSDEGNTTHISDVPPPPRRLLVFINPRSGPGKALQIFQERVVPLLAEGNLLYHVVITDRANCARNYVRTTNLSQWSGIVVVSGDGLVFEVFNGLMERSDWEIAIKLPVGIIPGGSGNGLARSISYATGEPYKGNMITASALHIIRGRVAPIDLVRVVTPEKNVYSFLSIGWGLMADIDIESERLRALGEARFTVWAVIRAISLRKYKGKLSFLPVNETEIVTKQKSGHLHLHRSKTVGSSGFDEHPYNPECTCTNCNDTVDIHSSEDQSMLRHRSQSARNLSDNGTSNDDVEFVKNLNDNHLHYDTTPGSGVSKEHLENNVEKHNCNMDGDVENHRLQQNSSTEGSLLPPLDKPVPSNWVVFEGEFVLVYVVHQTHLSTDIMFAPQAKLDDGIMWLVLIKSDVTRTQIMYFLSALQSATHMNFPFVDMIPIRAFRLEPATNEGFLTVDGESIGHGPIQAEVLPSVARVMTR